MRLDALREERADVAALRDRVEGFFDKTGAAGPSVAAFPPLSAPPVSLDAPDLEVLHRLCGQQVVAPDERASTAFDMAEQLRKFLN